MAEKKTTLKEKLQIASVFGALLLPFACFACFTYITSVPVPTVRKTYIDKFSVFGGDATVKEIEKTGDYKCGRDLTLKIEYEYEFGTPGHYLFEGWTRGHRSSDKKTEYWEFKVDDVPFTQRVNSDNFIYRLEATRASNRGLERETIMPKHYGTRGNAFYEIDKTKIINETQE